ncbi:hypothetical protein N7450_005139 [Penicillium hetheringtonii]|uniref:Xaa-Pro dipeptidyl-peptidase-like domain-containing protein n=1 Tax=Penicillium hetheringtonii TaxID=911720 RepID=A0AAD6GVW7_9EURO|nr:hypothetical protein N7450_005139 [Penicillium hetheringtonii]
MTAQSARRNYAGATLDYLGARYVGVGPEACSYTTEAVQIPMRDGVRLAADFYSPELPNKQSPAGLIMIQCCYGRGAGISFINARVFAARGYQALFVSTRGTHGSEGIFDPGSNEEYDSQDIVSWMRQQPWYPGSFATLGASYLGYSQWALLHDPPEDCIAAVIPVAPHDQAWHTWGTGSFRLDRAAWSDLMSKRDKEQGSFLSNLANIPESLKRYFGDRAPWLFEYLKHPNVDDEYWATRRHHIALERANIPILLVSGWYDTFTTQTLHQYTQLRERGVNVNLIVGPWTHVQGSGLYSMPEIMDFLAEHVAKTGKYNRSQARIYITGPGSGVPYQAGPHQRSLMLYIYKKAARPLSFIFDPLNPTPSIGGNQMSAGGRLNDSAYADRSDVLTFTSEALTEDLEILGSPSSI